MATKAQISTVINNEITTTVTTAKHKNALKDDTNSMLNELYKTTSITDTQTTTNIITQSDSSFNYELIFKKQGGLVYLYGNISNNTSNVLSSSIIATINNNEYLCTGSTLNVGSSSELQFTILNDSLIIIGAIAPFEIFNVNGVYSVNQ